MLSGGVEGSTSKTLSGLILDMRWLDPYCSYCLEDKEGKVSQQQHHELSLEGLDTEKEPVHELAELFPSLLRLRLVESTLRSFRDFGLSPVLRVFNAARCGVTDLDGVRCLLSLEELYLPFNDVEDCTALALHDTLRVLDLESNRVHDVAEIETLGTCPHLLALTLTGNPVARASDYYVAVSRHLTNLELLDDSPFCPASKAPSEDEEAMLLAESIKLFRPNRLSAENTSSLCEIPLPVSAHSCWAEMVDIRGGSSPQSVLKNHTSASDLTHGAGVQQLSGNIAKAIRRQRRSTAQASSYPETRTVVETTHEDSSSSELGASTKSSRLRLLLRSSRSLPCNVDRKSLFQKKTATTTTTSEFFCAK